MLSTTPSRTFSHPGPWRYFPIADPTLIGHNDIAPYNVCFDGDDLVGVFDWDMSGPTTPLYELAFIAWNCVPLWRDIGAGLAAERLRVIVETYGGFRPRQILHAVPRRIQVILDGIPLAAASGDQGMASLMKVGEPERSRTSLAGLVRRMPAIDRSRSHDRGSEPGKQAVAVPGEQLHPLLAFYRRNYPWAVDVLHTMGIISPTP